MLAYLCGFFELLSTSRAKDRKISESSARCFDSDKETKCKLKKFIWLVRKVRVFRDFYSQKYIIIHLQDLFENLILVQIEC